MKRATISAIKNPVISHLSSHSTLTSQNLISDYPVDISAGTQMMFIYLDIIHYQIVGDTKAPLLRVIDTNRRVKNGYVCSIEPNLRKVAYYHNQATMPHFSGHYRQRGSGFGALVMGIGRVALLLARKFIVPAAKRIGKELLVQAAPN